MSPPHGRGHVSMCGRGAPFYVWYLVDSSLCVVGETSPVLVGGSSVILAIGSSRVAAEGFLVPL